MSKTIYDFHLDPLNWLIDDFFPLGHRGMDTAPEGSFKTMFGCYMAVCIASGTPFLGHEVTQGPVLMVDEETPESSLENILNRFAKGLGYKLDDLPITRLVMTGFRFDRKTELKKILDWIEIIKPVFVRMDSMISMLPVGLQGIHENDSDLGKIIRDDLIRILNACDNKCSILLSAHSKKFFGTVSAESVASYNLSAIVRGHGSIVGEACDTGYVLNKINDRDPTQFLLTVHARRQAIPSKNRILLEIEEELYGKGWARLKEIDDANMPPLLSSKLLFRGFLEKNGTGGNKIYTTSDITKIFSLKSKADIYAGLQELLIRKIIIDGIKTGTYTLNTSYEKDAYQIYVDHLKKSLTQILI